MSSPSAAVNGDASMVLQQGRPLSSEAKEKAALSGMKAMHLGGPGKASNVTAGASKQSNKHNNAGKATHSIYVHTHASFYQKVQ